MITLRPAPYETVGDVSGISSQMWTSLFSSITELLDGEVQPHITLTWLRDITTTTTFTSYKDSPVHMGV